MMWVTGWLLVGAVLAQNDTDGLLGRSGSYYEGAVTVSGIGNLKSEISGSDIVLSWDFNADHATYVVQYQEMGGNYENLTDWTTITSSGSYAVVDLRTSFTFAADANKLLNLEVVPIDGDGNVGPISV